MCLPVLSITLTGVADGSGRVSALCRWLWHRLGHSSFSSEPSRAATKLAKPLEQRVRRVLQGAYQQLRMPYPRGVWACSTGACRPPGQLKEKELQAVAPALQYALKSYYRLTVKICFTIVPVIPCWVICNRELTACLFQSSTSLLQQEDCKLAA